jgi:hypothetical protein
MPLAANKPWIYEQQTVAENSRQLIDVNRLAVHKEMFLALSFSPLIAQLTPDRHSLIYPSHRLRSKGDQMSNMFDHFSRASNWLLR